MAHLSLLIKPVLCGREQTPKGLLVRLGDEVTERRFKFLPHAVHILLHCILRVSPLCLKLVLVVHVYLEGVCVCGGGGDNGH